MMNVYDTTHEDEHTAEEQPEEEEEQPEEEEEEPGATVMWFGKYEGWRLDKLPDWYRWSLVSFSYENDYPNLVVYREVHDEYLAWLDQRRSPLSDRVWFGQDKGHELRVLYGQPRKWRWLLQNCTKWSKVLRDIERRYLQYRASRPPRRTGGPRAPRVVVNPVGERLGPRDDYPSSDNYYEDYDSDDGFVVRTEDEDSEDYETGGDSDETDDLDPDALRDAQDDETESQATATADEADEAEDNEAGADPATPRAGRGSSYDSDASLPSLDDAIFYSAASRKTIRSAPGAKRQRWPSAGSETGADADASPSKARRQHVTQTSPTKVRPHHVSSTTTPTRTRGRHHMRQTTPSKGTRTPTTPRRAIVISSSSSSSSPSPSPPATRRRLVHGRRPTLSRSRSRSPCNGRCLAEARARYADAATQTDSARPAPEGRDNDRQRTTTTTTMTMTTTTMTTTTDSDDEPLVPGLRDRGAGGVPSLCGQVDGT
ncbi:hypothetical protein F4780DRAFT_17792 [Xylariomycetidae sp. FL0641]|nr:hypothetical protein F4780DRAFT_17792 [Xylariomycetidae sp. FL0641]